MSNLNSYSFTGRLGAPAEVKYTQSGTAIWSARVAVGYGYGDNKGTNWLAVQAFGKQAEGLGKLELAKGAHIGGSGELRVREYDKKDGSKGTSVEVNVREIALLGGKPEGERQERAPRTGNAPAHSNDDPFPDDDLPF